MLNEVKHDNAQMISRIWYKSAEGKFGEDEATVHQLIDKQHDKALSPYKTLPAGGR
jgi:hypothetical protein